jgi:uncharacterized protein
MRKCLLALFVILLALPTVLCSVVLAERVQDLPKPTNYVSDFAGVLSPETVASLNRLCAQVDRQAHAQIAVVTIKSLDGEPIENFATALEDKWKVGKKGTDRGVLVIFAISDRRYRIEVGYGLEGILPDGRVGDIGRQIVQFLQQNNYDAAASVAVRQIAGVIATDAGVTLSGAAQPSNAPVPHQITLSWGQVVLLGIVLLVVIFLLARFGGSSFLFFLLGMFMGGGGGGGGGGSDSGGGDSGGFGGFGGGSSGGGGASGSW